MVSLTTLATLFIATAAMAAPAAEDAQVLGRQVVASCYPTVAAGTFACGSVQNGCTNCAIVTGNSAGQCVVSSLCNNADGSCQTINGQPYCE